MTIEIPEQPEDLEYLVHQRLGPTVGPYFLTLVSLMIDHITDKERHVNTAKVVDDDDEGTSPPKGSTKRLPRSES